MLCPRAPDAWGGEHAGLVGSPAGAARGDHPVGAVVLEDGRCLVLSAGRHAGVASGVVQVVGGQLSNVERVVLLAGEDVVGLAVVVDVERHVTCHLPRAEVALQVLVEAHGRALDRPCAGVGPRRVEELIRPLGTVGHGHTVAGGVIALPLQLEMEPHAELLRHGVVDDLRTLQDAAALNVGVRRRATPSHALGTVLTGRRLGDAEGHAAVAPVHQVFRGIAHHADQCITGMLALMLAKPVIGIVVFQDAAAVGVDMFTLVVEPQLARPDGLLLFLLRFRVLPEKSAFGFRRYRQRHKSNENKEKRTFHDYSHCLIVSLSPLRSTSNR